MVEFLSPYLDKNNKPVLRTSIVAFIDILGYKDLIDSCHSFDDEKELFSRLYFALTKWKVHIDPGHSERNIDKNTKRALFSFKSFTDNIVIGYPIIYDTETELEDVLRRLSHFQLLMTVEGFFLRGAISIGELYMDDITVFGSGLVDAYKGESSLARDPRIILTNSTCEAAKTHLIKYGQQSEEPQMRTLLKDSDGQIFLNYLEKILPPGKGYFWPDGIKAHRRNIEENLRINQSRPPIWNKYMWVARYHNYYCRENLMDCRKSYLIALNKFQMGPDLISET